MISDWSLIIHRISLCAAEDSAPFPKPLPLRPKSRASVRPSACCCCCWENVLPQPHASSNGSSSGPSGWPLPNVLAWRSSCEGWGTSKDLLLLFPVFTVIHKHTDVSFQSCGLDCWRPFPPYKKKSCFGKSHKKSKYYILTRNYKIKKMIKSFYIYNWHTVKNYDNSHNYELYVIIAS